MRTCFNCKSILCLSIVYYNYCGYVFFYLYALFHKQPVKIHPDDIS